jgi:hypothetical protein
VSAPAIPAGAAWDQITGGGDFNGGRDRDGKRPVGYIDDWKPYRKTQIMLGQVQSILEEYAEHLPLTVRQVYYRMVAAYRHPKGKQFADSLYDLLVNARRAGEIPFEAIRDDGIQGGGFWYGNLDDHLCHIDRELRSYDADLQVDQPLRLEAWCEAAGMLPQLRRVCDDYSIPVYSCGGFNSLTAIRQIVDTAIAYERDTVILHLGDFDPSGVSIYERVVRDVQAFLDVDAPELDFAGVRVALTAEQIVEHNLPMDPITTRDSRSLAWIAEGREEKCELEALPPDVIASVLREQVEAQLIWRGVCQVAAVRAPLGGALMVFGRAGRRAR